MIRTSRIHDFDYLHEIETEYQSNQSFFREKELDFSIYEKKMSQNELFYESDSEMIKTINEGATDILRSVGEKIIEIMRSASDNVVLIGENNLDTLPMLPFSC